MAVVAGFLLTAVQNWTGIAMPHGKSLLFIWLPWFSARLIFTLYPNAHILAECLDTLFLILLIHPIARAIFQVKQYRQMGILSKLCLLLIANLLYLSGSLNWLNQGHHLALQLGFFLILSLVLTIGRRILPFFIEKGVGYPVTLKNSALKDKLSLITFLLFFLTEIFTPWHTFASFLALSAALTQTWRLIGWYTQGIWKKPLLWSLYLGMITIIIGLTLYFLRLFFPITNSLALHALAVGGIGIISLSMIGRVSLGHTGRNIHQPSKWLIFAYTSSSLHFSFAFLCH
nr:NnrS family protein [Rappaport israeli]